jgi:hypothetical protein
MFGKYWKEQAEPLPSARSVKYHIRRLLEIMDKDKPLADLSKADVHNYVVVRGKMKPRVSHATINCELDALCSAYMMARDRWGHPVRQIRGHDHRFPQAERPEATLSPEEVREAVILMTPKSRTWPTPSS